jgi:polyphosphate kinase
MPRNLNQRVEVLFPVEDPKNIWHIRDIILGKYLADNEKGRRMLPDGDYERNQRSEEEDLVEAQADLLQEYQRISETL